MIKHVKQSLCNSMADSRTYESTKILPSDSVHIQCQKSMNHPSINIKI